MSSGGIAFCPEVEALVAETPNETAGKYTDDKQGWCNRVVWEGFITQDASLRKYLFEIWRTSRLLWVEEQRRSGSPDVGRKEEGR